MKCNQMLDLMLEAESAELEGKGDSIIAVHVRECAKCHAVARALLADTVALAAASRVAARPSARIISRPLFWGGALAAAAAVAILFSPAPRDETPVSHVATVRGRADAAIPVAVPPEAKSVAPTRYADAVSATAVRFVESQAVDSLPPFADSIGVSVAAHDGRRSVVMATANPNITVVWIYEK